MHAKDVIRQNIQGADMILRKYVDDLEDADLLLCPVEGMNPIAWQLGHLIATERNMVEAIKPGSCPALPAGFAEAHPRKPEEANPASFKTKQEYLKLWEAQRAATLKVLDAMTDAELDSPSEERLRQMWPTVGAVMDLQGTHPLMHVGQFVAVRRHLKKPVAI